MMHYRDVKERAVASGGLDRQFESIVHITTLRVNGLMELHVFCQLEPSRTPGNFRPGMLRRYRLRPRLSGSNARGSCAKRALTAAGFKAPKASPSPWARDPNRDAAAEAFTFTRVVATLTPLSSSFRINVIVRLPGRVKR